jgi:hypothetical protein
MSEYMEKHTVSRLIGAPPGRLPCLPRRVHVTIVLCDQRLTVMNDVCPS